MLKYQDWLPIQHAQSLFPSKKKIFFFSLSICLSGRSQFLAYFATKSENKMQVEVGWVFQKYL